MDLRGGAEGEAVEGKDPWQGTFRRISLKNQTVRTTPKEIPKQKVSPKVNKDP